MSEKRIAINLFGACSVGSAIPGGYEITGSKHKALFALLATAPFGRRTRSFLQQTLWGTACYDSGRQSLRRALADIKQIMGADFGALLSGNNSELALDLTKVIFVGRPGSGTFLEGLDLRETGFNQWLSAVRQNPDQLDGLYSLVTQAPAMPMMPIVAVLPFRALGDDPAEAVLGDWLAEETCRSLSRSRFLAVISHLSCRELWRRAVDIAAVRNQLHADYCVIGTIRKVAGDLILDSDLIDTRSARILWTRRFTGRLDDFLNPTAEGIAQVVQSVGSAIADEALVHISNRRLADVEDHRLVVAGVKLMHRPALRDFARSRELLEEAERRAPRSAEIHAWLGKWHILSVFNGWSTDVPWDTQHALDRTARALDISPDNAFCLTIDGFAHNNLLRRLDIAGKRYQAALDANPNESLSWLLRGALHTFCDQGSLAVESVDKARTLSPIDPFGHYYDALSAGAHLTNGGYLQALELADRSLATNDRHLSTLRIKIGALHALDRLPEARTTAAELLRRQPGFTVDAYLRNHPSAGYQIGHRVAAALRAAGIP
jgi:TolB-like protein